MQYWEQVASDSEVGVSCKDMVIEAYISGAYLMSVTTTKSLIDFHNEIFKNEDK